ncbi:MAG TPA: hypothetical protein VIK34_06780 [Clostridiaceae bacterium]
MASEKNFKIVSRVIENIGGIPEVFVDGFKYSCMEGRAFPYTVHIAKYDDEWYEKSSQLITVTDDGVFVFEVMNDQARLTHYAFEHIIFLKRMDFAKTAQLIIKGTSNRKLYESMIEYDIKDKQLFDFIVVSARIKEKQPGTYREERKDSLTDDSYELLKLAYFKDSHVKLYNYAVGSLMHDQKIRKTLLQSKVFRKNLLVLRKRVARTHVVILAGSELIVIEEGKYNKKRPDVNEGGYWYFIPISNITAMDIKAQDGYLLILTIKLKERVTVELYFDSSLRMQLEQLAKSTLSVYNEMKEN